METGTISMQRATETAASCTQAGRRSALNGIISIRIPARGCGLSRRFLLTGLGGGADGAVVYFYHGIDKREELPMTEQEMKARIERSRELID